MNTRRGLSHLLRVLGRAVVLGAVGVVLYLFSDLIAKQAQTWVYADFLKSIGGEFGLVLPALFALFVVLGLTDIAAEGRILYAIGKFVSLAFPGVGTSMMDLRRYYGLSTEDLEKEYHDNHNGDPRDIRQKDSFSQWVIAEIIPKYENNLHGFVYGGAALLIFVIGLRGLQVFTKEQPLPLVLSLQIEFILILLLGLMVFFKPEDSKAPLSGLRLGVDSEELKQTRQELDSAKKIIGQLHDHVGILTKVLCQGEQIFEEARKLGLDGHLKSMHEHHQRHDNPG
jgi:hypothetical protein